MPFGIIGGSGHMFAANGLEASRFLKLYDPWGGIFDVDVSEGKQGFDYVQTDGEYGNNQLKSAGGKCSATILTLLVTRFQ